MQISGRGGFQAEKQPCAKALRQAFAYFKWSLWSSQSGRGKRRNTHVITHYNKHNKGKRQGVGTETRSK